MYGNPRAVIAILLPILYTLIHKIPQSVPLLSYLKLEDLAKLLEPISMING